MKTFLTIAAAGFQLLVLGYMSAEREWVLRTGRVIHLRTEPIDPRDAMRGDYVRLNYEISSVPRALCRDGLAVANKRETSWPRDTKVYASLRMKDDGLAELVSLSDKRPADGLFLRGRLDRWWNTTRVPVRYGLEAYFMQQGKALELEQSRNRGGVQVPLEMEVAVSPGGLGVLKGRRWSPLGIGLELTNTPATQTNQGQARLVAGAKVTLLNTSDKDIAIVDQPGGRSLALVPDSRWQENRWRWVHEGEPPPRPEPGNVILLKPGQTHEIHVDFGDAYWFVEQTSEHGGAGVTPTPLRQINPPWGIQFRLVYRPPEREDSQDLPNAQLLWRGRLPSRAFTPAGSGAVD